MVTAYTGGIGAVGLNPIDHRVQPTGSLISESVDRRGAAIADALMHDAHLPLALFDLAGIYHAMSAAKAKLLNTTPEAVIGKHLRDLIGADMAIERLEHARRASITARPLLVECTMFGTQTRTILRLIPPGLDQPSLILATHHIGHAAINVPLEKARYDVVRSRIAPPIPVAQLTVRERDVLAMIAQGLTQAEIARRLGRSVKTIEWHRASLGKKLHVNSAVELAHIAFQHGLVPLNGPNGHVGNVGHAGHAAANGPSAIDPSGSPVASDTSPRSGEQSPAHAS